MKHHQVGEILEIESGLNRPDKVIGLFSRAKPGVGSHAQSFIKSPYYGAYGGSQENGVRNAPSPDVPEIHPPFGSTEGTSGSSSPAVFRPSRQAIDPGISTELRQNPRQQAVAVPTIIVWKTDYVTRCGRQTR